MRLAALALTVLGLALASLAPSSPPAAAKTRTFTSSTEVLSWINRYRAHPRPKELPAAVRAMSAGGMLEDLEGSGLYVGFIAGVLGSNQLNAGKLVKEMLPLGTEGQVVLIRAVAYSGLPEYKLLLTMLMTEMPDRRVLISKYINDELETLDSLPVDSGRTIDTLWGYYVATGSYEPVQRIISVLSWASEGDDVEKLTIASMAKLTLATNASRDPNLLKLCYVEREHRDEAIAKPLGEVIDAAETFELAKLRKEATAALEELKTKGPESTRTLAWAGNIGTTVLAVGCVAASALGQAEIAVPCVVTGAVSSAALKLLTAP